MRKIDKKAVNDVFSGISSAEEAQAVAEWFSSSIEGQQALSDMFDREAYLIEQEIHPENSPSEYRSQRMWEGIQHTILRKRVRQILWRAAAAVIPFVALLGVVFYLDSRIDLFGKSEFAELYVPKGQKSHLVFQDGSEVFLNADSRIKYPKKFGIANRTVFFEGEGYFKVASNKHRPFLVKNGNTAVKVLGTSFNVNAYADSEKMRVALDEGSILFQTVHNQYRLNPGQQIIYSKTDGNCLVQNLPKALDMSLWKDDVVLLHDTPLSEVLKILERRYDVAFRVKDPKAIDYTFTLTTRQTDVKQILQELQKIAPVKFIWRENVFEVSLA